MFNAFNAVGIDQQIAKCEISSNCMVDKRLMKDQTAVIELETRVYDCGMFTNDVMIYPTSVHPTVSLTVLDNNGDTVFSAVYTNRITVCQAVECDNNTVAYINDAKLTGELTMIVKGECTITQELVRSSR